MVDENATPAESEWRYLLGELGKRTTDPLRSVPFVIYTFIGTLFLGGLGIWTEVVKILLSKPPVELASLLTAISTFFPALVGSAALQLVFAAANKSDKVLIAFAWFAFCIFLAAAVLLSLFSSKFPVPSIIIGTILSIGAVWFWWITNGVDPLYKTISPDAPTGGPTDRNLSGTLDGYVVQ